MPPRSIWARLAADPPENFWRSLSYFNWYRLVVAAVFLGAISFLEPSLDFGYQNPRAFRFLCILYLTLAAGFFILLRLFRRAFNLQLTVQVAVDILVLTLLMYYSGGARSGLAFMLLVVLAAAGLVGQGRLSVLFAALATLAVLVEQAARVLTLDADLGEFTHSGLISIGFFATASTARLLARRVVTNEQLALQRGQELQEQTTLNEQVIRDMEDGVLVVDAWGGVQQANPRARALLAVEAHALPCALIHLSVPLAQAYAEWSQARPEKARTLQLTSGQMLRVRFLPAGNSGNALLYLEDMARIQEQAQQMKLAALGRLTANMAHEIRNPLAAISHAAELLADEQRDVTRQRLTRIIGDNTQRLNRLVAEVLELGRRTRAQPEPLPLKAFVQHFLDEYAVHDPRVLEIVRLEGDPQAVLLFDRGHLEQVLSNLVSNALRHGTGASAGVRVDIRPGVPGHPEGGHTELHLVDDGLGIAEAVASQIFEPFFTNHPQGTGLGLYIARELCEANGAQLLFRGNAPGAHFCVIGKGAGDENNQG